MDFVKFVTGLIHRIFPSTIVYNHKGDTVNPVKCKYRMIDAIEKWKRLNLLPIHSHVNVYIDVNPGPFQEGGLVGKITVDKSHIHLYVERTDPEYVLLLVTNLRKIFDSLKSVPLEISSYRTEWGRIVFNYPFPSGRNAFNLFANTYNLKSDSEMQNDLQDFFKHNRNPEKGSDGSVHISFADITEKPESVIHLLNTYKPDADEVEIDYYVKNIKLLKNYLYKSSDCRGEPWITEIVYNGEKVFTGEGPIIDNDEIRLVSILWMPGTVIHLPKNIIWSHGTIMKDGVIESVIDTVPIVYREEVKKRVWE